MDDEVVIVYCGVPSWTGSPVSRSVQFSYAHAVRVLRDDGFFPHYGKNWMQIGTQKTAHIVERSDLRPLFKDG
jgi:hypothetical protein